MQVDAKKVFVKIASWCTKRTELLSGSEEKNGLTAGWIEYGGIRIAPNCSLSQVFCNCGWGEKCPPGLSQLFAVARKDFHTPTVRRTGDTGQQTEASWGPQYVNAPHSRPSWAPPPETPTETSEDDAQRPPRSSSNERVPSPTRQIGPARAQQSLTVPQIDSPSVRRKGIR
jgi:hypothetical protein